MESHTFCKFWQDLGAAAEVSDLSTVESDDEEGSLFELELAVPPSKNNRDDHCSKEPSISPHRDLFFKNRVMPLENSCKTFSRISTERPPPRSGFFALRLGRSKSRKVESRQGEACAAKLNAGGEIPATAKSGRERFKIPGESKKLVQVCVQKYLKLIQPLYVGVSSKRRGEKGRCSETASFTSSSSSPPRPFAGFMPRRTGLRQACKQLGKSRSASATATSTAGASPPATSRRDDSLVLQDDGIQSAIQHCKRSLSSCSESFPHLSRSTSSPCDQMLSRSN